MGVKRCRSQRTISPRLDTLALCLRSRDFERLYHLTPVMVEQLAGEFFNSSVYDVSFDDPATRGNPSKGWI